MGFRAIARVKNVNHTTVMNWVKSMGQRLPDTPENSVIPEVGELDELEISAKKFFGFGQQ